MFNIFKNLLGDGSERAAKQLDPIVKRINSLAPAYAALPTEQLAAKTDEFRRRFHEKADDKLRQLDETYPAAKLHDPVTAREYQQRRRAIEDAALDDLLPEAFAAVREASRRKIGLYHYDVQLTGGIVLHQGKIAEMKTGEGKTLVASLPMYLNALAGHGVHLVTVNDYLARRDAGWMGPIFNLLGLSVGFIAHEYSALFDPEYVDPNASLDDERLVHWRPCSRPEAYKADITYGTNNEFGFDYLRDNGAHSFDQMVQRGHYYAIVDEVDNILIDEARTPLIISGPARESSAQYARFARLVDRLRAGKVTPDEVKNGAQPDGDALLDPKTRSVVLTDAGLARVEEQIEELGPGESVYDPQHSDLTHYLENALKAKFIFHRDKDYIVSQQGEVIIVDEFTGRLMPGRRWSDGLHQAVEAKEGVAVRREQVTYATITFQNYFRMYGKLAGMTGTAATEREEFGKIYNLDVVVIPPNKPIAREDLTDQIYRNEEAKFQAVVKEIEDCRERSQPVLVGTTSVSTSERLSRLLKERDISHQVLNAKQHRAEARVVAQAARPGVVTIATNMAGRGTDILLGGNAEALAAQYLDEQGLSRGLLIEVAQNAFGEQKNKVSRQKLIERSNGKLDDALIDQLTDAMQRISDEYERLVEIIDVQNRRRPERYLIETVLSDIPQEYFEQKRRIVQAVLQGYLGIARAIAAEIGVKEDKIAEIRRVYNDYRNYRNNRSRERRPAFLAAKLFDQIYAARGRMVQLMLRGDEEQARLVARSAAGLKEAYIDDLRQIFDQCEQDRQRVRNAGGLHIIGTERHEARRIDNQLRGRAGRQGDPGSSRFYLSLEDELMHRFGRMDAINNVMGRLGLEDDMPIEARVINRSIESAQTRVEGYNFDARKHTVEYDDVMNKQRETIYARRRQIMEEANAQQRIEDLQNRYLDPDAFRAWAREEIRAAAAQLDDQAGSESDEVLADEEAQRRIAMLLPGVDQREALAIAADDARLDAAIASQIAQLRPVALLAHDLREFMDVSDEEERHLRDILDLPADLHARLRELIDAPEEQRLDLRERIGMTPELEQQVRDSLDAPGEVERLLRRDRRIQAESYVNELWRAQNPGNVEDRIKEAFENELTRLVDRYLDGYDDWMDEQIREVIADATNPATDELNIQLVQRRLATLLPDLASDDPADLGELSAGQLTRRLEGYIAANRERGYNIDLLVREISSRIGVITDAPDMLTWLNVNSTRREQLRQRYVALYGDRLNDLMFLLDDAEQERIYAETLDYVGQQLRPVLAPAQRPTPRDLQQIRIAILDRGLVVFREVLSKLDPGAITETLRELLNNEVDRARADIGVYQMGIYQRSLMLQTIDLEWQQYLTAMDDLRQGIGLQAIGQRDPLVQYQTEGYRMFSELLDNIDQTMVQSFFHRLHDHKRIVQQYQEEAARREAASRLGFEFTAGGAASSSGGRTLRRELPKVGRNDLCPCGSGKKYKHCHGSTGAAALPARGRDKEFADGAGDGATNGAPAEERPAAKGRTPPPANGQGGRGRNAPVAPQRGKQPPPKRK